MGYVLAIFLETVAQIAWGGSGAHGNQVPVGSSESLAVTAVGLVGLWIGLAGSVVFASRTKGTRSIRNDFGLRFRPSDLPVGVAIGVVGQLALVPLLYLPWEAVDHTLSRRLSQPAHRLAGGYHGIDLAIIGLLVSVGSPFVEELYFRGLLLSSLQRRLAPSGSGRGIVLVVAGDGLLFALFHFEPLQFLGLAAFGIVLAGLMVKTGRLGTTIVAHAAFNAVTVIALAAGHG